MSQPSTSRRSTSATTQAESVEALVLNGTGELETEVSLEDLSRYLAEPRTLIWCDIATTEGGQESPYGGLLREVFGFDELTIEDCFTTNHLPKVNLYDDYLFVVLFSFHLSEKRRRVETVEVDMYIGENFVVCIHSRPLRELERVKRRLLARNEFVFSSPANVAHTVFDTIVDEYLPIMNRFSAMVDSIEDELLAASDASDAVLDSLFHLKHDSGRPQALGGSFERRDQRVGTIHHPTYPRGEPGPASTMLHLLRRAAAIGLVLTRVILAREPSDRPSSLYVLHGR